MTEQNILIVEDDKKITELLTDYLEQSGFKISVLDCGDHVIREVMSNPPNLIILDIMLPGKDGMTICRELRAFSKTPVIMLTGKVEEIDRVLGLELGADDYICKPFSLRELVVRIKNVLRRSYGGQVNEKLIAGPITIYPDCHDAIIGGENLRLTPNEFELLKLMAFRPNKVFTRSDFVSSIQGYDFKGSERVIDSHIKNLRKKISKVMPENNIIQTIYGIGYLLNVPRASHGSDE